ncbi:HU family DNA-binding protein [Candidatus Sumerlaeota bacterium]|nr:HU family DNA-binding protein [Candidatus Sumerlaeota bacterium]
MTKAELVDAVAAGANISKAAAQNAIDSTFVTIAKVLKKEKRFSVPQFGTFKVTNRKARKGRNPQTGEEIKIKASKGVSFKASPTLKEKI